MNVVSTYLMGQYPWLLPNMPKLEKWGIAGGWAVDFHLGQITRHHKDLEIAILRNRQASIRDQLAGWNFDYVEDGTTYPWPSGRDLLLPVHEIHAIGPDRKSLEILLNEGDADQWIYRRDPRITLPLVQAFLQREDFWYLSPLIVLLYKSKKPRPKDEQDFRALLPILSITDREWLAAAIELGNGGSTWVATLLSS